MLYVRAVDGSAMIEMSGGTVVAQRGDDGSAQLVGITGGGVPVQLAHGSLERVREGITAVFEAARKGKHFLDLEEIIGPNIGITVASAMPEAPSLGDP